MNQCAADVWEKLLLMKEQVDSHLKYKWRDKAYWSAACGEEYKEAPNNG